MNREGDNPSKTGISVLLDRAERLRRAGKLGESLTLVDEGLSRSPDHPRALLTRCRLLIARGDLAAAASGLRALISLLPVGEENLRPLERDLGRLAAARQAEMDPAFATENMGQLLARQGYLLEAMGVYRRLYYDSGEERRFWEELLRLRNRAREEGSREKSGARLERELKAWDRWLGVRGGK